MPGEEDAATGVQWRDGHFKISGMHCVACAESIRRVLARESGVSQAEVSFAAETLSLLYDPQCVTTANIAQWVAGAGYRLVLPTDEAEVEDRPRPPFIPLLLLIPLEVITLGRHFLFPQFLADYPLMLMVAQAVLAAAITWCGRKLLTNGVRTLIQRQPNMYSLIAIGTTAALAYSVYLSARMLAGEVALLDDLAYETGSLILFFVMLGHYFEERSRHRGRGAVAALAELQPETARIRREGGEESVAVATLQPGDVVIVRQGERVPADGRVQEGQPWLDQSVLTGESLPVQKAVGDEVVTGALNQRTPFLLRVEKVGEHTALARMTQMVLQAQASQMPINRLADRISAIFVPIVIGLALAVGVIWWIISRDLAVALDRFVAVLIISCPCALGLASPMAVMVAIAKGMRLGFIVRQGAILEKICAVNAVVFDKTGTLTIGRPRVSDVKTYLSLSEQECVELAASGESLSEHPLAQAVLDYAKERGYSFPEPQNFASRAGRGISFEARSHQCLLGSLSHLQKEGVEPPDLGLVEGLQRQGKSIIALAVDQKFAGLMAIRDPLKEGVTAAVDRLQEIGTSVMLLSGDNVRTAQAIGSEVGIKRIMADVLPEDKQNVVTTLQGEGRCVLMAGDGVNDAPALAQADVGVAMGAGSDLAHESGDVILMNDKPASVVQLVRLGRATVRIIKQNLFWAFIYNLMAIPLAAGVFVPMGLPGISPVLAAPMMAMSSITVVLNALRLGEMDYN